MNSALVNSTLVTQQIIAWEWLTGPGLEHLILSETQASIHAQGWVVGALGQGLIKVQYAVTCNPAWQFQHAHLTLYSAEDGEQPMRIAREPAGAWVVNGEARPDLAGCTEIDIRATPFTNTLPIRRLRYEVGVPQTMTVAFIKAPTLEVVAIDQEYTKLNAEGSQFRYRNLSSGFTAELNVDAAGVVLDYAGAWRRIGPRA